MMKKSHIAIIVTLSFLLAVSLLKTPAQVDLYPEWRAGRTNVGILDAVKTVSYSSPIGHTNFALTVTGTGGSLISVSSVTDSNFVAVIAVPFAGEIHYNVTPSR